MSPRSSRPGLVFVRMAGLPVEAMAPFASVLCLERLRCLEQLGSELERAREELVGALYPLVHGAAPQARRFLLALKRDAFNGRSVLKYAEAAEWPELEAEARAGAERVIALEKRLAAQQRVFEEGFAQEQAREARRLGEYLTHRELLRAIALGSPLVATQLGRLRHFGGKPGRREKKLQLSLLRYLSRAAFKLSPFSTFTPLALGELDEELDGAVELLPGEWRHESLLRVQPAFLDQVITVLLENQTFRLGLPLAINATLEETEPRRFRWFRPGHWSFEQEKAAFRYNPDAVLKVELKDELILRLVAELRAGGNRTLAVTLKNLEELLPEVPCEQIALTLEKLRGLGFFHLKVPWPNNALHLEAAIAEALGPGPLGVALAALVQDERAFAAAEDPASALEKLDARVDEIWKCCLALAGRDPSIPYVRVKEGQFFEDVLRAPATDAGGGGLLRLPAGRLRELCAQAEPLVLLSDFLDRRHDFLQHVGAILEQNWAGETEVGLLEVFDKVKSLFAEWTRAERSGHSGPSFNIGGLAVVEELARRRHEVRAAVAELVSSQDGESRIDSAGLAALVASLPAACRPLGPCLFLQPADTQGQRWVVNRIYEGTGRYSSRFTALLEEPLHQRFVAPFLGASMPRPGEGPWYLLDLLFAQGDTLNVRRQMTARLVTHPGEIAEASAGAHVSLGELRLRRGGAGEPPTLVDGAGRRFVPVHLGGAARRYLPTLFRFLSLFGPSELQVELPPARISSVLGASRRERLLLGDLILQRQRWIFELESLPAELFEGSEEAAYAELDRWRRRHDLPCRVFLIENVHHATRSDLYKPQFLDLSSPLFVSLLRSALKVHRGAVCFEEMVPSPELGAPAASSDRWLFELLVESSSLQPAVAGQGGAE